MEIITTVQAVDDSINLNLTKQNFNKAYRAFYVYYQSIKSNPLYMLDLFEISVDMNMMMLASDIRKHMEENYNAFWKQHLATLQNGK